MSESTLENYDNMTYMMSLAHNKQKNECFPLRFLYVNNFDPSTFSSLFVKLQKCHFSCFSHFYSSTLN